MIGHPSYFEEESPRAEILQGAMEEFIEFGKKGARMQSIADRAGVNKALLHYYFSTKENLHKEVLRRVLEKGFSQISQSLEIPMEPADQIRSLIHSYFEFFRKFPELPKLMIHEITSSPQEVAEFFGKLFSENPNYPMAFAEVIREGIARKQFRPVDPRQFLITTVSAIIFFFVAKPLFIDILEIEDGDQFLDERLDHLQEILMDGLERSP